MSETFFRGAANRVLQLLARLGPGARTFRVRCHKWRGVKIGQNVWIGYDAIIETSYPHLVTIEDDAAIHARVMIVAHFRERHGVRICRGVTLGPGVIVMPNVTIGEFSVVTAGSVVTKSIPERTLVQGNPAVPVAKIGLPMKKGVSVKDWAKHLKPIRP